MNVLIVDDEPLELEQLNLMIKQRYPHWNIFKAGDSIEASSIYRRHKIHIAFLDIQMPGKSGLEVCEEINSIQSETDIVIVSAFHYFPYAKKAIKLGVTDYLTKPIISDELQKILDIYKHVTKYSPLINDIVIYIHEHYQSSLSLSKVALQVHCNSTYVSRRFHEEVGITFTEYVTKYRIEKSKQLLVSHPDWTISEVAEKIGFNSQHYFSSIFSKYVRISPKMFKQKGVECGKV